MSEHSVEVLWTRQTETFEYEKYDRTHSIEFEGGQVLKGSSAPEFLGKSELANPEEMLAAALSSCHMLTSLAVASKSRLTVDSYQDSATAYLEKNAAGKLSVSRVILRPRIEFASSSQVSTEKLAQLHDKSHHNCFIAQAVKCEVIIEPVLEGTLNP